MAKKHIIENRRLGKFEVSIDLINDAYPMLSLLFSDVLIIVAEVLVERDAIRYVGISDNFAIVLEGASIPFYKITVRQIESYLEIVWIQCKEQNLKDPVSIKWEGIKSGRFPNKVNYSNSPKSKTHF